MDIRRMAFAACLLLAGAMAPDLRAEEGIAGAPLAEVKSKGSPDSRFRLVWWDDQTGGRPISGVRVEETKRERVVWKDLVEDDPDLKYAAISSAWTI